MGFVYSMLLFIGCVFAIPIGLILFSGVDDFVGWLRNRDVIEKLEEENKKLKEHIKNLQSAREKRKKKKRKKDRVVKSKNSTI